MKKIIDKSYNALLTIFFTLFILVIRLDSTNHNLIYFIGLILLGLFIASSTILLNKCKKIDARRGYIITMCCISSYLVFKGIYYMVSNSINVLYLIYLESFIIAICITSFIFSTIFLFKDLFKKGYVINKCDMYCFKMLLNMVAYLLGSYLVLKVYGKNEIISDPISRTFLYLEFGDDNKVLQGLLIGLAVYVVLYATVTYLEYRFFEKETIDKDQRDFK